MEAFGAQKGGEAAEAPPKVSPELKRQIDAGVALLREGGVVAFPTDTLYGLGADFANPAAVQRVLEIKGRPQYMGLPLLLSDADQLPMVASDFPEAAWLLVRHFWPGALTLVVARAPRVPDIVTGGRASVAVRVPNHPVPRALAHGLGRPITGTSANPTGKPPAHTAEEVRQQLGGSVDMVIKGGIAPRGIQSTIMDATGPVLRLIRPGAIPFSAIQAVYPGATQNAPPNLP